jgi:hypothetical protein
MRRLALAIFLACALSGGARAGEIHPTGVIEPPAPTTVTTTGEIHTTEAPEPQASSTVLTMILTLISIVR